MYLYLVRHGESEDNKNNVHNRSDVPLSPLGHQQAACAAQAVRAFGIELLATSPLLRALQTAEYFKHELNLTPLILPELQEIRRPSELLGKSYDDPYVKEAKRQMYDNAEDPAYHFSDEENFFEFKVRCKKALETLLSYQKERVLAISHGYTIRMLVTVATMESFIKPNFVEGMRYFWDTNNGAITILRFAGGQWHLHSWNTTFHLQSVALGISS